MKLSIKKLKHRVSLFFIFGTSILLLISCKNKRNTVDQSKPPGKAMALDVEVSDMNIAEGTATVRWTALTSKGTGTLKDGSVATVKGYDVEYSKGGSFSDDNSHEVHAKGNETGVILTGLKAGETYSFKVYAKNDNPNKKYSKGPYSDVKQFKFGEPSQGQAPGNPTELEATVTSSAVTVSFKPSETPGLNTDGSTATVTGYGGQISENQNFSDSSNVSVSPDMASIVFSGLRPDTRYYVKIFTTSNSTDQSKRKSDGVLFDNPVKTLPPGAEPPSAPTNVALEGRVEGNSATLKWSTPSDPGTGSDGFTPATITGYIVEICPNYDFFIDKISYAVDATSGADSESYQLNNLMLGQTYYARVFAVNDNDRNTNTSLVAGDLEDGFTIPNEHATDSEAPGMPSEFKAVAGVQSVELSWKEPDSYGKNLLGGSISKGCFEVEISSSSDFSGDKYSQKLSETSFNFKGLNVGTEYYARVRTNNNSRYAGVLRYSPWLYLDSGDDEKNIVKTKLPTPPGSPKNVELVSLEGEASKNSLQISWTAPENTGLYDPDNTEKVATIVKYIVYYAEEFTYKKYKDGNVDLSMLDFQEVEVSQQDRKYYEVYILNLKGNTVYGMFVVAVNDNPVKGSGEISEYNSEKSKNVYASTSADCDKPGIPYNLEGLSIERPGGRTQILLSWDAPEYKGKNPDGSNSEIVKYYIYHKTQNSDSDYTKETLEVTPETPSEGIRYTIADLEPNTEYNIYVVAVNANDDNKNQNISEYSVSENSSTIVWSTLDNSEIPSPPSPPELSVFKDGTANPGKDKIKFDIPEFMGYMGKDAEGNTVTEIHRVLESHIVNPNADPNDEVKWYSNYIDSPTDATTVLVKDLLPGSKYVFRIKVITVSGGTDVSSNTSVSSEVIVDTISDTVGGTPNLGTARR